MPVIEMPNPLNAADSVASGYAAGKEQKESDEDRRRALLLESRRVDLEQKRTESEVQSQQLHDRIDQHVADFNQQLEPLVQKQYQATLDGTITANETQKIANQGAAIELQTIRQAHAEGIDIGMMRAALTQAKAQIGQTLAQTHLAYTQAQHEQAMTYREYNPIRGGAGGGGGASYRDSLSATGQQFYDMLFTTNNPPSRQQAALAIKNPSNRLTPDDRRVLMEMLTSEAPAIGSNAALGGNAGSPAAQETQSLERNPQFGMLPPAIQQHILKQVKAGVNVAAIRDDVVQNTKDPVLKQQILTALGGTEQPAAAGANPFTNFLGKIQPFVQAGASAQR